MREFIITLIPMDLATSAKRLRNALGYSRAEMARAAKITDSAWFRIESGKTKELRHSTARTLLALFEPVRERDQEAFARFAELMNFPYMPQAMPPAAAAKEAAFSRAVSTRDEATQVLLLLVLDLAGQIGVDRVVGILEPIATAFGVQMPTPLKAATAPNSERNLAVKYPPFRRPDGAVEQTTVEYEAIEPPQPMTDKRGTRRAN